MDVQTTLAEHLAAIVATARFAPSVHNTQPWTVHLDGDCIRVGINKQYALSDGDPTGRQTIISLGIFCEALSLGADEFGLTVKRVVLERRHAEVQFTTSRQGAPDPKHRAVKLLKHRSSDRSIYRPAALTRRDCEHIEKTAAGLHANVRVVIDRDSIQDIARLTGLGIGLALSSPSFRKELSRYLVLPWSSKHRGIAVKSLYINPLLACLQPLLMRAGLGVRAEAKLEQRRWESASAVVVILGDGDLSKFWLESGRAYLRASLAIEALGLSQATSAAIVEASNYHEDIEERLGTDQRILALMRIGKGSQRRHHSPRVDTAELLTSR